MKRKQRAGYLALANALDDEAIFPLCSMCKYGEVSGACDDQDIECEHPFWQIREVVAEDAGMGGDCWAFKPDRNIETAADTVGVLLQGHRAAKVIEEE